MSKNGVLHPYMHPLVDVTPIAFRSLSNFATLFWDTFVVATVLTQSSPFALRGLISLGGSLTPANNKDILNK